MTVPAREPALFRRYPALRTHLPFVPLGKFPTPVDNAPELAQMFGVPSLSIKRDDISASDYGGNKIRKLEFLLGDAAAIKSTSVLTFGGLGSNHALATAINCKRLGIACGAVLTYEPITPAVRRTLAYHLRLGTRIEFTDDYGGVADATERLQTAFGQASCYEIPLGGSNWIGALGFVDAGLELGDQIAAGAVQKPDIIYIACGTAGTVAGLDVGLQLAGVGARIEALQVTPDSLQPEKKMAQIRAALTNRLHALEPATVMPMQPRVNVRNDQLGAGYAIPTLEATAAAKLFQEKTGLPAALTYTAKALAGLVTDARHQKLAGASVMFWNTYNSNPYPELGQPDWAGLPSKLQTLLS